jgi:T5orf172 domain
MLANRGQITTELNKNSANQEDFSIMSQAIWQLTNFDQFWQHVPTLTQANYEMLTLPEVFRITLSELDSVYGNRLPIEWFDKKSHDQYTIATDAYSFPRLLALKNQPLYGRSKGDGTGWIYIYSNIAEIGIGRYEEGFLWWKSINYKSRLKIGRTERHVVIRLKEQAADAATVLGRKPVILGAFWSPKVVSDERAIHQRLSTFRANDAGGTEWFECRSVFALEAVRTVVLESRQKARDSQTLESVMAS